LLFGDYCIHQDSTDESCKVQPVLGILTNKFSTTYTPQKEIILGKGMLAQRNQLQFQVYSSARIVKCDIMMRMVCESATRYICDGNDITLTA
jgi:hypothetical protein